MNSPQAVSRVTVALWMITFAGLVRADVPPASLSTHLSAKFDLAGERTKEVHYFDIVNAVDQFELNGQCSGTEQYRAMIRCEPHSDGAKYTCKEFIYRGSDGKEVTIPSLKGWSYVYKISAEGLDDKGQVFGIDHAKFENLIDSRGNSLTPETSYMVYNTFIDFHGFCDLFARPAQDGNGIQHLSKIGDRVIHSAANSRPPTHLGANVKDGSYFQNGEITLTLDGVSMVDDRTCAVVGFDSGRSSFHMILTPMPNMEVQTDGGSHYLGDIYVDLQTKWPRKVDMHEWVISETVVPMPGAPEPMKIHAIHERNALIRIISKAQYEGK